MNHLKLLPTKKTNKLFMDKFRYKIVLVSKFSPMFRSANLDDIEKKLNYYIQKKIFPPWIWNGEAGDYSVANDIVKSIKPLENYKIMVSSPFISLYTDNFNDFKTVTKELFTCVKYISVPEDSTPILEKNTVYLKRIDYDYKVTISNRIDNNESFFKWCRDNDKIRMPERCQRHVKRGWRVGDSYFYVKDAKSLSMVQMFIGSNIQRIDRVVKI